MKCGDASAQAVETRHRGGTFVAPLTSSLCLHMDATIPRLQYNSILLFYSRIFSYYNVYHYFRSSQFTIRPFLITNTYNYFISLSVILQFESQSYLLLFPSISTSTSYRNLRNKPDQNEAPMQFQQKEKEYSPCSQDGNNCDHINVPDEFDGIHDHDHLHHVPIHSHIQNTDVSHQLHDIVRRQSCKRRQPVKHG